MNRAQLLPMAIVLVFSACDSPNYDADARTSPISVNLVANPAIPDCPEGIDCVFGQQGRSLLGIIPSIERMNVVYSSARWGSLTLTQPPIQSVSIDARGFKVVSNDRILSPEELVGLEMRNDAASVTFRIAALWNPDTKGRARYIIEFSQQGDWQSLCPDGAYAYAIPGAFDYFSQFTGAAERGTLACAGSAAAKAIRWGIGPLDIPHPRGFSAAVRLATAEYCANGISHTIDGTSVVVATLDTLVGDSIEDDGPSPRVDYPGDYYFEAAWRGNASAFPVSTAVSTPDRAVVCLSKLRWQSLPPGGYCPYVLPDPRLNDEFNRHPVFCDDLPGFPGTQPPSAAFMTYMRDTYGATVASMSQFNDRGLWAWPGDSTSDMISTTRGFWAGGLDRNATERPAAGFGNGQPTFVARVLTAERPNTKPLFLYRNASGHYLTSSNPSLDVRRCTTFFCMIPWVKQGGPLGWVYTEPRFVPEGQTPIALRQWVRKVNGVVMDTVLLGDGVTPPPGYEPDGTNSIEGWGF